MSRYSLDYGFTCPDLDKEITEAKEWVKQATDSLYSDLESIFENCRSINEGIRSAADQQIAECVSELEDAEFRIKELEDEL